MSFLYGIVNVTRSDRKQSFLTGSLMFLYVLDLNSS